jgi:hypothetical protein
VGTPGALGAGFVWSLIDVGLPDDRTNLFVLLLIGNTYLQFFNQMFKQVSCHIWQPAKTPYFEANTPVAYHSFLLI